MKSFELGEYMKPMISRPGIIASRQNKFFLKYFTGEKTEPIDFDPLAELQNPKLPKIKTKSKKIKNVKGSYSFKTVGRNTIIKNDSPPPGRYSPRFEFLYKKSPNFKFSKNIERKRKDNSIKISSTPEIPNVSLSQQRIPGIPFDKQLKRKPMITSESPHEKRFESFLNNSLLKTNKVHSFCSYTPRKPHFRILEHMPDYSPRYENVAKVYKNN